jgi:hypothetical protein
MCLTPKAPTVAPAIQAPVEEEKKPMVSPEDAADTSSSSAAATRAANSRRSLRIDMLPSAEAMGAAGLNIPV